MKKRTVAAGVVVLVACVLAGWRGIGIGLNGGDGASPATNPRAAQDASHPRDDETLIVRIEGNRLLVGGRELSADAIARLAAERRAAVEVIRADDATVGANDELLDALHARQIHPRLR